MLSRIRESKEGPILTQIHALERLKHLLVSLLSQTDAFAQCSDERMSGTAASDGHRDDFRGENRVSLAVV